MMMFLQMVAGLSGRRRTDYDARSLEYVSSSRLACDLIFEFNNVVWNVELIVLFPLQCD
jgi:hypothetical protein